MKNIGVGAEYTQVRRSALRDSVILLFPLLAFTVIYFCVFLILENWHVTSYYYPYNFLDKQIPFIPCFVLPYLGWFIWLPLAVLFVLFSDPDNFPRLARMLMAGMTVFLLVSAFFPTKLYLRPTSMPDDGFFCRLVTLVYSKDTPTNVFPSIHVYNTCVALFALLQAKGRIADSWWFRTINTVIAVAICLSTLFIKQHALADVIGALVLFFFFVLAEKALWNRKKAEAAA